MNTSLRSKLGAALAIVGATTAVAIGLAAPAARGDGEDEARVAGLELCGILSAARGGASPQMSSSETTEDTSGAASANESGDWPSPPQLLTCGVQLVAPRPASPLCGTPPQRSPNPLFRSLLH